MAIARATIAYHNLIGNGNHEDGPQNGNPRPSMSYILESLAIEHDKAYKKYIPLPYFGDVVLFRATKQLPELDASPLLGWKGVLVGNLDVCGVPGHQQNILIEPNLSRVADELETRLKAAQHRSGIHVEAQVVNVTR
jgi:hypothetical protein